MIDYLKAGLWDGIKKWAKIIMWVALGAVANALSQLWLNFRPHDVLLHFGNLDYTLTAGMINIALTGAWNGFIAGFFKWVNTKADDAKSQAGL